MSRSIKFFFEKDSADNFSFFLDFCFELSLDKFCLLFNSLEYLSQTFVVSRKRFSSRQQRRIDYSGFQGEVYLKNVSLEVIEFLLYGEILAVGKNTSFGAGCYQLKILNR